MKDKLWMWIAWRLPKRLVMWAAVRVMVHATQGNFSSQIVPELKAVDALKRWLPVLLFFCLAGCFGGARPPVVSEASNTKRKAYQMYAEGQEQILDAILAAYKAEARARISLGMQKDIETARHNAEKTDGKVSIDQALTFAQKLMDERDAAMFKVDASVSQLREIMARNKVNLAIAMKLDEAIEAYETAGYDMSAAKNAVGEIMDLIAKTTKGK